MSIMGIGDPPIRSNVSHDAIVLIPGIMGSELVDTETGKTLWATSRVLGYAFRWGSRPLMAGLAVRDEERDGKATRVSAPRLIAAPHMVPSLGGVEPYGKLATELRNMAADPAALLEFPYDWRLSVRHNAGLLAVAMHRHLEAWRKHPAHDRARRLDPSGREAMLILVAHSMGGLLAQALPEISGATDAIRAIITIGTPFHGSINALELLGHGSGAPLPLPRQRLRDVARTMPGVYDLLPSYRCLRAGDAVVQISPGDVSSAGADPELAEEALTAMRRQAGQRLPGHVLVTGTAQPTAQSMELAGGQVLPRRFGYRWHEDGELVRDEIGRPVQIDYTGDGTVYLNAARIDGVQAEPFAQQHGALVRTRSILGRVRGVVVSDGVALGATLGQSLIGLDVPEVVTVHEPAAMVIREAGEGRDRLDPASVSCAVHDVSSGEPIRRPRFRKADGEGPLALQSEFTLDQPGLYRVTVSGGMDPVSKLILAVAGDPGGP